MTVKQKINSAGIAIFFFIFGMAIGQLISWKNFKRDQNWIKKEIVKLESERAQIDNLIQALQDMMDEVDQIERIDR